MKKYGSYKSKNKMLMHIPKYKLNRIIDKTHRPFSCLV